MAAKALFQIGSVRYMKTKKGFKVSGIGTLLSRRSIPLINVIQVREAGIRYGLVHPRTNQKKASSRQRIASEIQKKGEKRSMTRVLLLLWVLLVLLIALSELPPIWILVAAVTGLITTALIRSYRILSSRTILLYQLDRRMQGEYKKFNNAFQTLKECEKLWFAESAEHASNLNATIEDAASRITATLHRAMPKTIESNISAPMLNSDEKQMVFLPDSLLVIGKNGVVTRPYNGLRVVSRMLRVVEESHLVVPADARVVDNTWRHVKPDGNPDPNYEDNPEMPIVLYGEIIITGNDYFEEVIRISKSREADDFVMDFERYLANFRQGKKAQR